MAKKLTVFGATGAQGGSLISYILEHPKLSTEYTLRGGKRLSFIIFWDIIWKSGSNRLL